MHMWEKRVFKDPRFQNTKSWETVLEWLSEWKCTHIRSLFLRSFPYHHHCCMVQMRSDGRWLCASVTPYKKSKKNVCLNALLLCDLETGYAKRNGERVKCLGLIWGKRKIINVLFRNIVVVFVCNEIILLWKFFKRPCMMKLLLLLLLRNRFALRNTFKKPLTCFRNCCILNYIVVIVSNEANQEWLNSKNSNWISFALVIGDSIKIKLSFKMDEYVEQNLSKRWKFISTYSFLK